MKLINIRINMFNPGNKKRRKILNFYNHFIRSLTFEQSDKRHLLFTLVNQIIEKVYEFNQRYQ